VQERCFSSPPHPDDRERFSGNSGDPNVSAREIAWWGGERLGELGSQEIMRYCPLHEDNIALICHFDKDNYGRIHHLHGDNYYTWRLTPPCRMAGVPLSGTQDPTTATGGIPYVSAVRG
jgi:hypothetical protein